MYSKIQNHETAETFLRKALSLREKYTPNEVGVATICNSLGWLLTSKNKLDEAEKLLQRSIDTFEQHYGPNNISECWPMNNLASLWEKKKLFEKSEQIKKKTLDIRIKILGTRIDPEIASSLANLGSCYKDWANTLTGKKRIDMIRNAVEAYQEAYETQEILFGETNRTTQRYAAALKQIKTMK